MSKITHYFDLNVPKVEHHLVSESDALTITAQASAGEGETFLASKHGASNHVAGFKTGEDKILVPLDLIQEIKADTAFVKGPCPAAKFQDSPDTDDVLSFANNLLRYSWEEGYGSGVYKWVDLLALDGTPPPTLAAADIEII